MSHRFKTIEGKTYAVAKDHYSCAKKESWCKPEAAESRYFSGRFDFLSSD